MSLFKQHLDQAILFQQECYEMSADWNCFNKNDIKYLKNYIGYGIFGEPKDISNEFVFLYEDQQQNLIETMTKTVVMYVETEDIYCSFIYGAAFKTKQELDMLDTKKEDGPSNENESNANGSSETNHDSEPDEASLNINRVPILKLKRLSTVTSSEKNKERRNKCWFFDTQMRIYKTWNDFLHNNTFEPCTIVLPKDGNYQFDPREICTYGISFVYTEHHQLPINSYKILQATDIINNVLSCVSLGVVCATSMVTVAPAVVTGAIVASVGTSLYSGGRGVADVVDRGIHGESLIDKKALEQYLSIGTNVLSVATLGASKYLSNLVSKGKDISKAVRITCDAVNISAVTVGGAGIIFKAYNMFTVKNRSNTDWIFLVADIFFFSNAVINLEMSKSLIKSQKADMIENYKNSLSNKRHRKSFNKKLRKFGEDEMVRKIVKITTEKQFVIPTGNNNSKSKNFIKCINKLRFDNMGNESSLNFEKIFLKIIEEIKTMAGNVASFCYDNIISIIFEIALEILSDSRIQQNGFKFEILVEIAIIFLWIKLKNKVKRYILTCSENTSTIIKTFLFPVENYLDSLISEFIEFLKNYQSSENAHILMSSQ